ncbi:MAG TPA: putative baseplate assembly protein [Longimicrobiaceae bacterium]|nr:putative baseplate assembly protein [Longimicrobiaceae bacterium]
MPIAPPPLEARTFDELVQEARRRIARYTPELALGWTDHNESDPGITLVQLFAWLAQITQERVNQLPERTYRALLDLLGMQVRPAVPAFADLVFDPIPGAGRDLRVPAGTRVGAPPGEDGNPVTFETAQPLDVVGAVLAHVLTYDGTAFREVTPLNGPEGGALFPFGERPETGAALYFGFAVPPSREAQWRPFPGRVSLRAFEPEGRTAPAPVACGSAPAVKRAAMAWEYLPGPGRAWEALAVFHDETRALEVGGYLSLQGPREIDPAPLWTLEEACYWVRLRLRDPDYGTRVPRVGFFRFNTVPARHQVTVNDERLGTASGAPGQTVQLRTLPLVPETLTLEVADEGGQMVEWHPVALFRDPDAGAADPLAGPDARVYRVDPERGTVSFGDGRRGAIPPAGSAVVAREYRSGGGAGGNQEAGGIASLQTTLPGIKGVTNPRPAVGGLDAQTAEQAARGAPQWLRRRERAVTADDFEAAAEEIGGVVRAVALAGEHPDYPEVRVPGAVTVLVVQDSRETPPVTSEDLLRAVCAALEAQRTLTTEVYVRPPRFVRVDVAAELRVDPQRSMGEAQENARTRLEGYLDYRTWSFGQDLHPATVQSRLLSGDDGVRTVERMRITVDGRLHESATGPVRLPGDTLVYAGQIDLAALPYAEQ